MNGEHQGVGALESTMIALEHAPGDSETAQSSGDTSVTPDGTAPTVAMNAQSTRRGIKNARTLARGDFVDRYVVLSRLGEGGMGIVYLAYDPELNRRVALKFLLSQDEDSPDVGVRLLREAQAMAQLSHPNIVAVHDVGTADGRVWIAMEFVEGITLSKWLAERPRDWREVLAAFQAAGEGLRAAHLGGLIHRDFKPDNVMVSQDGRIRVMDFGLARATHGEGADRISNIQHYRRTTALDAALTGTGAILGTPRYMAPEQWMGQPALTQTDQFAFCVSLWEALYHAPPFEGNSPAEIAISVTQGKIKATPSPRIPTWIKNVLVRGLALNPAERWPTMDALLAALSDDPGRARRRWMGGLGGMAFAALAVGWVVQQRAASARVCLGADERISAVWNLERASAVERAIRNTGQVYASDTWSRVEKGLELYLASWRTAYVNTCEATWVRGEQSAELLDLRMECLSGGLKELDALVDVLAEADIQVAERAVQAVADLRSLRRCDETSQLRALAPPPPGAVESVKDVRSKIAQIHAEEAAGRHRRGLQLAEEAVEAAESTNYAPVRVETLVARGRMQEQIGEYEDAARTLTDAYVRADAIGYDEAKAEAAVRILRVVGDRLSREYEVALWVRLSDSALDHLGRPPELVIEFLATVGIVRLRFGNLDEALAMVDNALDLEAELPGVHPRRALLHRYRGNVLYRQGKYAAAQAEYEQSVALAESIFGEDHPDVAASIGNLGETLRVQGKLGPAEQAFRRSLAIFERVLGSESPRLETAINGLATIAYMRGDFDAAAREYSRLITLYEHSIGGEHPSLGVILGNLGEVRLRQGKPEEARKTLERAIGIIEGGLGVEHALSADAHSNLGETFAVLGEIKAAEVEYDTSIAILERTQGSEYPELVKPLQGRARLALAQRRPAEAVQFFERAHRLVATDDLVLRATVSLDLANALWDGQLDLARARALVETMRADLVGAALSTQSGDMLEETEAWLRTHPAP